MLTQGRLIRTMENKAQIILLAIFVISLVISLTYLFIWIDSNAEMKAEIQEEKQRKISWGENDCDNMFGKFEGNTLTINYSQQLTCIGLFN